MPIYEYRCPECDETFSKLQRMGADAREVVCPKCGHAGAERQLSGFASASSSSGPCASGPGCGAGGFT